MPSLRTGDRQRSARKSSTTNLAIGSGLVFLALAGAIGGLVMRDEAKRDAFWSFGSFDGGQGRQAAQNRETVSYIIIGVSVLAGMAGGALVMTNVGKTISKTESPSPVIIHALYQHPPAIIPAPNVSSLISCPDCGKEVSRRAPQCPQCGCPIAADDTATDSIPLEETNVEPQVAHPTSTSKKEQDAKRAFARAKELFQRGEMGRAVLALKSLIQLYPGTEAALHARRNLEKMSD